MPTVEGTSGKSAKIRQDHNMQAGQADQKCTGNCQSVARHHGSPPLLQGASNVEQNAPQVFNRTKFGMKRNQIG